ncbi:MAG TPA: hypothetical protein PLD59_16890, partial [Tepidisphaeraceae bacterium]|nr:hypothetical protein [Tepidisphaeraceae bacterium]
SATLTRSGGTSDDEVKILALDPIVGIGQDVEIEGFNIVRGGGSTIAGTVDRDILIGTTGAEEMDGLEGDDILITGPNIHTDIDTIDDTDAFAGDTLMGGRGADLIFAWSGNNTIVIGNGDEVSRIEGSAVVGSGSSFLQDDKHQPFTSEEIEAAYKWMYGDDIWLRGFNELGGTVSAVKQDGRYFSNWSIDWQQDGWFGSYLGYDVKIEHDIGGGSVVSAAAALREAIMLTTWRDWRWIAWMQGEQANNLNNPSVYGELVDTWQNLRAANFERGKQVAAIAAELQLSIITLPLGAVGEVADVIISVPDAVQGDVGAMLAMLPLVPGAIRNVPTRARALVEFGFDSFRMIGRKGDVLLRENATLGFVLRYDLVRATGEWVAPKIKHVDIGNGRQTWIVGDAQKIYDDLGNETLHSAPHAAKITDISNQLAATGRFSHITLNRSVRTATGRGATAADQTGIDTISNIQPDIVAVRWDGKVEMYEVLSPSQDEEALFKAMRAAMRTLPTQYQTTLMKVEQVSP